MKNIFIVLIAGLLIGCATPVDRLYSTPSGKVEILINADKKKVTDFFINDYLSDDFILISQTPNSLIFESNELSTGEEIYVSMTLGNSYSTNSKQSHLNLISVNNGKATRVFFKRIYIAQMPFGQINKSAKKLTNDEFNSFMKYLTNAKFQIESK